MQNLSTFLFLALAAAAFYFLIIRPGKQRQKAQAELLTSIAPGTEVMTTAGVFGRVVTVSDDVLGLEIAPGVVMRVLPAAVARVVVSPGDEPPVD